MIIYVKINQKGGEVVNKIRIKISNYLVKLAVKLYPQNPKVMEFYSNLFLDESISGGSVVRVDPESIVKTQKKAEIGGKG